MEKVFYADVFFLVNFGIDILTVCLTAKMCRIRIKTVRAIAGAVVGALSTVFITLLFNGFIYYVSGIAAAILMSLTAFGAVSFFSLLRQTAILWSTACLLLGAVTSLKTAIESISGTGGRIAAAVAFAVAIPIVIIVSRFKRERSEKKAAYVRFSICGKTVGLLCLVDSGNLLKDPVSGDPVIIVASGASSSLPAELISFLLNGSEDSPLDIQRRIRAIPAKTMYGEGLLYAIRPDALSVDGTERKALISLREAEKGSFSSYDGIVPLSVTGGH